MAFSRPILIEHELTVSEQELRANDVEMEPPQFPLNTKNVLNWLIIELNRARDMGEQEWFGAVFRCRFAAAGSKIHGKFSFFIKSANFVKHVFDTFSNEYQSQCHEFCTTSDLLNPEKKFIEDGKLTIQMKGMLFQGLHQYERSGPSLGNSLWFRDDRDFVISVGKENEPKTEIKIHKLVLASRSSVFDRMLQTDMKEKAENKLEIIDFDANIVQKVVDFFYEQGTFLLDSNSELVDFLSFANKYDINDLKDDIGKCVMERLDPSNVCQFANAAVLFNCATLKDLCLSCMIVYIKQEIPFDDADNLDKDFAIELIKKASMPTVVEE